MNIDSIFLYLFLLVISLFSHLNSADTECQIVSTSNISDRRTNKNNMRIVQYNVEWLFMDYCGYSDCPGNGCTWVNQSEASKHMDYVVNVINDLNPDIINFCELEGCDELNMLKTRLTDGSTYLPYLKKGTDTGTGQNVGMLTRVDPLVNLYRTEQKFAYPIAGSNCDYKGNVSTSGVSKHYITEFQFADYHVAFIAAHLIALPTDSSRCAQREAQASVLQEIIVSYIQKNYEVIMMGDFNDYDAEILDLNSDKPLSMVLDILKGNSGEYAGKYQLHSIAESISQSDRYTEWWNSDGNCDTASNKDFSMIDHILVTPNIQKKINNVFIYHGYKEYCGKYDSDHFPVVMDLSF